MIKEENNNFDDKKDIKVMSNNEVAKNLYNSLDFNDFKIMMRKEISE